MYKRQKNDQKNGLVALSAIISITLFIILYFTNLLSVQASQIITPTPEPTATPIPIMEVGDTTELIVLSVAIVIIILAGVLWPRHKTQKNPS